MTDPQPGDFLCTHISGNVGTLIGVGELLATKHPLRRDTRTLRCYSHAAVYIGDGQVLEAEPGGARIAQLSEYQDGRPLAFSGGRFDLDDAIRSRIVAEASKMLNAGYSAADYFAIAAKRFRIPAPHLKAFVNSSHRVICSQLVAIAYANAGVPLFPGSWPGYTTPMDLARLIVVAP